MKRSIALGTISALVMGLGAAGCGGEATGPVPAAVDSEFEATTLATVGIAEDQANGSSSVPLLAGGDIFLALATDHGVCAYSISTGRSTCPDVTRGGITISRSFAAYDAAGNAQPKRDASTVRVNTQVWARGTAERPEATVTIDRKSDLTTTGVQPGSPNRTLNGTEQGTSTIVRRTPRGTVRSNVVFGDTTANLVIPNQLTNRWPTSGTVIHSNNGTRTVDGQSGSTPVSYRAVAVFAGGSVTTTITANGRSKTCVRNLQTGARTCS